MWTVFYPAILSCLSTLTHTSTPPCVAENWLGDLMLSLQIWDGSVSLGHYAHNAVPHRCWKLSTDLGSLLWWTAWKLTPLPAKGVISSAQVECCPFPMGWIWVLLPLCFWEGASSLLRDRKRLRIPSKLCSGAYQGRKILVIGQEVGKARRGTWNRTEEAKFCHFNKSNLNIIAMFQGQNCQSLVPEGWRNRLHLRQQLQRSDQIRKESCRAMAPVTCSPRSLCSVLTEELRKTGFWSHQEHLDICRRQDLCWHQVEWDKRLPL